MFQIRANRKSLLGASLSALCVLALGVLLTHPAAAQGTQSCQVRFPSGSPDPPPPPTQNDVSPPSPNTPTTNPTLIPADECEPSGFSGDPIPHFDDYSWRAFIALVWPAKAGQRAVPDPTKPLGAAGVPSVFETYKTDWETFQPNAQAPTEWNSFSFNSVPCKNANDIHPGDMVLASFHEFGNIGEAGIGSLVNVLVAQNRTYVVYLAAYNQLEFNLIAAHNLYDAHKLPKPGIGPPVVPSPIGAMTLKSSWIDMTGIAHPERFHTRTAWIKNISTGVCEKKTVGLVGLHIVQKTPNRPQWIWSTFEQVDNVPGDSSSNTKSFNNGDGSPMPTLATLCAPYTNNNKPCPYLVASAPASPPPPFNVVRDSNHPISSPDTVTTNGKWQKQLQQQGSVWQFYELTMTQWPVVVTQPPPPSPSCGVNPPAIPQTIHPLVAPPPCDGSPPNTFPGTIKPFDAPSAFANTTLETFDQQTVFHGCMACHNSTRTTDFVWSLPMLASNAPSVAQTTLTTSQVRASALSALQAILAQPPH